MQHYKIDFKEVDIYLTVYELMKYTQL